MSKDQVMKEGNEKIQNLIEEKQKDYYIESAAAGLNLECPESIQATYNQQSNTLNAQIDAELNKMSDAVKAGQANTCANYNRAS